jgi:arsenite/tail-anchored protein-transporting ATPase
MPISDLPLDAQCVFVGGKGGVGKTTVAAALAIEHADAGRPTLVLSTDPAHSLGDVLGLELGSEPTPVPGVHGLHAAELDAQAEQRRFVAQHRAALERLADRGTYLDAQDLDSFLTLTLPGIDEIAAVLRLLELSRDPGRRLVVDTAPTGHTLRLLEVPQVLQRWVEVFEAMEAKGQQVSVALVGAYREDEASAFLRWFREELARLNEWLRDPARTRFLLVCTPEPMVEEETERYLERLRELDVSIAGLVLNRAGGGASDRSGLAALRVPALDAAPAGVAALRGFSRAVGRPEARVGDEPAAVRAEADHPRDGSVRLGERFRPPADKRVYMVGGKGGVGKTTTAASIAVWLAGEGRDVLLVSTDPAGSLADVFGVPIGDTPALVGATGRLRVRQLDAAAVWQRFRNEYRDLIGDVFRELFGGVSAEADQRVMERLVDLAPPGIDELMALV